MKNPPEKIMTGQATGHITPPSGTVSPVYVILRIFHFPDFSSHNMVLGYARDMPEAEEHISRLSTNLKLYDATALLGFTKIEHVIYPIGEMPPPGLRRPSIDELVES
jgi:hypothetical protein